MRTYHESSHIVTSFPLSPHQILSPRSHAKIARVIEARFPNIKTTEPEVLAHHLTAAGLAEAAIPLWQSAGELALKRMALAEAIAHLNQGLELVSTLARSSQRDASAMGL